jgi:TrmH family RNA methyltransferase
MNKRPSLPMDTITSSSNAEIKMLRSLHERKYRRQTGLFLAEGMRHCTEAVQMGYQPMRVVYAEGRKADKGMAALIDACQKAGGRVLPVTPNLLSRISGKDNPQTVIAAFSLRYGQLSDIRPDSEAADIWIALDRVRDPGNLGTIMRTADAVAAKGIILIEDCTDPYSVEAVRASMGAVFTIEIIQTSSADFIEWSRHWPGQIIGTALPASKDYRAANWQKPLILLMGNEQAGLTDDLCKTATQLIRLPMLGRSDSLNLGVATGICLYEAIR